ncbi:hypothetical protein VTK56DRAFT_308 [Thermocarpiscus australiensis]
MRRNRATEPGNTKDMPSSTGFSEVHELVEDATSPNIRVMQRRSAAKEPPQWKHPCLRFCCFGDLRSGIHTCCFQTAILGSVCHDHHQAIRTSCSCLDTLVFSRHTSKRRKDPRQWRQFVRNRGPLNSRDSARGKWYTRCIRSVHGDPITFLTPTDKHN